MAKYRTRKQIEKRIRILGGTYPQYLHGKKNPDPEVWRLARKFNKIVDRERLRKRTAKNKLKRVL